MPEAIRSMDTGIIISALVNFIQFSSVSLTLLRFF